MNATTVAIEVAKSIFQFAVADANWMRTPDSFRTSKPILSGARNGTRLPPHLRFVNGTGGRKLPRAGWPSARLAQNNQVLVGTRFADPGTAVIQVNFASVRTPIPQAGRAAIPRAASGSYCSRGQSGESSR